MDHARVSRRRRLLFKLAVAGLAFEAAAFLDPFGASASDLDLLVVGGAGGSTGMPPPNVMFLFDDSGSMNNLMCTDSSVGTRCSAGALVSKAVPNGATLCESPALSAATGTDTNGSHGSYRSAYGANGQFVEFHYPAAFGSTFDSGDVFVQWPNAPFESLGSIASTCSAFDTCEKRHRCMYSLQTQGYFWEPLRRSCGSGDPTGMCAAGCGDGKCKGGETEANCPEDCAHGGSQNDAWVWLYALLAQEHRLFLGDFLNFYPPKGVALKAAFTDLVDNMTGDVRLGVATLSKVEQGIFPPCSQVGPECFDGDPSTECYGANKTALKNSVRDIPFNNTSTRLAKALSGMGAYYAGQSDGKPSLIQTSVSNGGGGNGGANGNNPICAYANSSCDVNSFVVMVTDGLPTREDAKSWSESELPWVYKNKPDMTANQPDNGSWLDETALALTQIDALPDHKYYVDTYTVSYGEANPDAPDQCAGILDVTARNGGGRCLLAKDAAGLRSALAEVVQEIINRVRGFTAPSMPTTRSAGASSLSSAVFKPSDTFPLWEGHIYGFKVCDTKLARDTGTTCTCPGDQSVDQICIEDANEQPIVYDKDGFLTSLPYWDAQLCLSGNVAGTPYSPPLPPDPHDLDVSACYRSADDRVIKTAIASHGGGEQTFEASDVIDFTTANVSAGSELLTALDVGGVVADGQKVVSFFRGKDAYDTNGNGVTTEDRNVNTFYNEGTATLKDGWWKLGEVFHSIPVTVGPPTGDHLTAAQRSSESWKAFKEEHAHRQKQLLVGANDGMLHSFVVGTWSNSYPGGYDPDDAGNGKEAWAFVSPELLKNLKAVAPGADLTVSKHVFRVDGSVEVRDVWVGGTADQNEEANADKWRTIAIYGHRDGGSTYVALDVTDADDAHPPTLLWQFPQPSMTEEKAEMARSWLDVAPAPASIGVLLEQRGNATVERWVALLSGGFDPSDEKGRMLVALDVSTGAILWEARHTASNGMDYSFPATPVFFSRASEATLSIDGIVAADHGGQLWYVDTPKQALTNGRFDFEPKRFFQAGPDKRPIAPGEYQRWPFFFAPTLTFNGGKVRVIIGTGDRDQLIPAGPSGPVGGTDGYVCTDKQRLYAIDVGTCENDSICDESDLDEVSGSGNTWTYATAGSRGWWYELPAGEKAATPFNIFHGYAMYSTFLPTIACGVDTQVCSADAKGEARMYVRHYLSGKPLDWNGDNSLVGDTFVSLGQGVPTAPSVSVGVSAAGSTPAIFAGGSDSGLKASSSSGLGGELSQEVLRFYVSSDVHEALH